MKKTIGMKIIMFILAGMMLINGILPTKVYAANNFYGTSGIATSMDDYTDVTVDKDGWYKFESLWLPGQIGYQLVDFFYEKDGENWYPTMDEEYGYLYLKKGITYYVPTGLDIGVWGNIPDSRVLVEGIDIPDNTEGAPVEKVYFEDPDAALGFPDEDTDKREPAYSSFTVTVSGNYYEEAEFDIDSIYYKDENGKYEKVKIESWSDDYVEHRYVHLDAGEEYYTMDATTLNNALMGNIEPDSYHDYGSKDDAALIENIITKILLLIGAGLYALVSLVVGKNFSIEKVIFNDYANTKLGFFSGAAENPVISASVKETLNELFNFFSGIALAVYLVVLVYMAIKIILGATAERGSKYKQLIMYWLEGVLILFVFPYIMKYSIQINDAFVSFVYENKNQTLQDVSRFGE